MYDTPHVVLPPSKNISTIYNYATKAGSGWFRLHDNYSGLDISTCLPVIKCNYTWSVPRHIYTDQDQNMCKYNVSKTDIHKSSV